MSTRYNDDYFARLPVMTLLDSHTHWCETIEEAKVQLAHFQSADWYAVDCERQHRDAGR
jgi:hypothetical protein